jgi:5-methylcytosine-specific restriction endonuclease McrA
MCLKHKGAKYFKRNDGSYRCSKCASEWVIKSRRTKKERIVKMFGGKCILCGYKKYSGALDFHHINPGTKSFALSVKGLCYSWATVVKEAQNCVLLCKNCHTEVENGKVRL